MIKPVKKNKLLIKPERLSATTLQEKTQKN